MVTCSICHKDIPEKDAVQVELIRHPVMAFIQKKHPEWSKEGYICLSDLSEFRSACIEDLMVQDRGQLSVLENQVLKAIRSRKILSKHPNTIRGDNTLGQRLADRVASFGGSWPFIICFFGILMIWIIANSLSVLLKPFDPYPYILLNLVLSCLAAVQAPIIMMSQNRKEEKDRARAEHDYQINLKAELEIRMLGEKLDLLLHNQWEHLLEIQQEQIDILKNIQLTPRQENEGYSDIK